MQNWTQGHIDSKYITLVQNVVKEEERHFLCNGYLCVLVFPSQAFHKYTALTCNELYLSTNIMNITLHDIDILIFNFLM